MSVKFDGCWLLIVLRESVLWLCFGFFLNFDFEMATYWAIVGLSHALRYHYEAQARALTASRLETRLVEAQLQTLQRQIQPQRHVDVRQAVLSAQGSQQRIDEWVSCCRPGSARSSTPAASRHHRVRPSWRGPSCLSR